MSETAERRVLCVNRDPVEDLCHLGPWSPLASRVMRSVFQGGLWAWRDRAETERESPWRQVIPVLMLRRVEDGAVFLARRQSEASESRLAGLWTCLIGGHVDWPDDDGPNPIEITDGGEDAFRNERRPYAAIRRCLEREYREETRRVEGRPDPGSYPGSLQDLNLILAGVICSNLTDVDRAHLGIVHVGHVPVGSDLTHGEEFAESRWYRPGIDAEPDDLESWARIALSAITAPAVR